MKNNTIVFYDVVIAAQLIAELVKQGIVYTAYQDNSEIHITTTGGFCSPPKARPYKETNYER
jgi:hypothetical protein